MKNDYPFMQKMLESFWKFEGIPEEINSAYRELSKGLTSEQRKQVLNIIDSLTMLGEYTRIECFVVGFQVATEIYKEINNRGNEQ